MVQMLFDQVGDELDIQLIVVWIRMLPRDCEATAIKAAEIYKANQNAIQFFDPHCIVGRAIASSIGHPDKIAWDMYLLYNVHQKWAEKAPAPMDWVHQLGAADWADATRYRWGINLYPALRKMLEKYRGG